MKKINNKGFAFVELLAVTVVIMLVFMSVYSNFFPISAELENRLLYNDVSSTYASFYMRKVYKNENLKQLYDRNNGLKYVNLIEDGSCVLDNYSKEKCNDLLKNLEIESMILTKMYIGDVKDNIINNKDLGMSKYVSYLPNYNKYKDTEDEKYRLIIKTKYGYANTIIDYDSDSDTNYILIYDESDSSAVTKIKNKDGSDFTNVDTLDFSNEKFVSIKENVLDGVNVTNMYFNSDFIGQNISGNIENLFMYDYKLAEDDEYFGNNILSTATVDNALFLSLKDTCDKDYTYKNEGNPFSNKYCASYSNKTMKVYGLKDTDSLETIKNKYLSWSVVQNLEISSWVKGD